MTGRRVTIAVRRTDGTTSRYQVEAEEHTTILDALEEIRTTAEPELLYRHSCHHGSCGTCGVLADGQEVLACTSRLGDLPGDVSIEPLPGYPAVGDLAVDPGPLLTRMPASGSYLRPSEAHPATTRPSLPADAGGAEPFVRFENCIECGLCVSACPVTRPFMGPAALAAYGRELEKHPEREADILPAVGGPDGVDACERALRCSAVCPLGVYPARHIVVLARRIAGRPHGTP